MTLTVKKALPTLGTLGVLGPISTDIFLPALPLMATFFAAPASLVQLSLGSISIGMAIGQLFGGIIADRLGRRRLMIVGALLASLSAFAAAASTSVYFLIAIAFLVGLGSSTGMIVGRAVIADISNAEDAHKGFAVLGSLTGIGAIAAPLLGSALLALFGWQSTFLTIGLLAAFGALLVALKIPETLHRDNRHTISLSEYPKLLARILSNRRYLVNCSFLWFGFALGFAYISASSFIVQVVLGWSVAAYAVVFGVNAVSMAVIGFSTGALADRFSPRTFLACSVTLQLLGSGMLVYALANGNSSAWLLLPALWSIAVSMGFVFGPATGNAMRDMKASSGTALALMGAIQFVFGGVSAPLVGVLGPKSILPLTMIAIVCSLVNLSLFAFGRKHTR